MAQVIGAQAPKQPPLQRAIHPDRVRSRCRGFFVVLVRNEYLYSPARDLIFGGRGRVDRWGALMTFFSSVRLRDPRLGLLL
jgi:hypothetical protein